jgi:putative oxidoreductase
MVNAIGSVHADKGLWVTEVGYEYNLVLIAAAIAMAFFYGGGEWGGLATLAGLAAGATNLMIRTPAAEEAANAEEPARAEERRAA